MAIPQPPQNFWQGLGQGLGKNSNALIGLGSGLLSQPTFAKGLAAGGQGWMQGAETDDAWATTQKAEAQRQAQLQAAVENMRKYNPQIADMVAGGMDPRDGWNQILTGMQPGAGPEPTANMRDFQFAQENPGYADFLNPQQQPDYPSGYQGDPNNPNGMTYVPGGPADPATRDAQRPAMNATTQKELFEAEDAVSAGSYVLSALDQAMALNDQAIDGPYAGQRATIGAAVPDMGLGNGNQQDYPTIQYQNITTELALTQLKTIFGSMPTEGERKILLELQGSVDQPRAVRAQILARAKEMAIRRIEDNRRKAEGLRSGAYFEQGYGQPASQPAPGATLTYNPATGELE